MQTVKEGDYFALHSIQGYHPTSVSKLQIVYRNLETQIMSRIIVDTCIKLLVWRTAGKEVGKWSQISIAGLKRLMVI